MATYHRPTETQLRVLHWVAQGYRDAEIAEQMGLAPTTVKTHVSNAMRRMRCQTRAHAVTVALCEGWLDCPY